MENYEDYLPNEQLWNEFKKIKEQNYQLRRTIKKREQEIKGMKKFLRNITRELNSLKKKHAITKARKEKQWDSLKD